MHSPDEPMRKKKKKKKRSRDCVSAIISADYTLDLVSLQAEGDAFERLDSCQQSVHKTVKDLSQESER